MNEAPDKPLQGIRVLDLTRLLSGPVATMHLADMGADVIKIEDPGLGDYARTMGHVRKEVSQFFIAVNRGKQGMHLDLKNAGERDNFLKITPVLRADEAIAHPLFQARGMVERKDHPTEGEYWSTGPAVRFIG